MHDADGVRTVRKAMPMWTELEYERRVGGEATLTIPPRDSLTAARVL
jgi:hypothetical protein